MNLNGFPCSMQIACSPCNKGVIRKDFPFKGKSSGGLALFIKLFLSYQLPVKIELYLFYVMLGVHGMHKLASYLDYGLRCYDFDAGRVLFFEIIHRFRMLCLVYLHPPTPYRASVANSGVIKSQSGSAPTMLPLFAMTVFLSFSTDLLSSPMSFSFISFILRNTI